MLETLKDHIIKSVAVNSPCSGKINNDELVLYVGKKYAKTLLRFLRDDSRCLFATLLSICGVDNYQDEKRFVVVYNLLSLKMNCRLRVNIEVSENEEVDSVTGLYRCAAWYEREVWDMYGIKFAGNNDLRRILTDYGFEGHPLRKDFPLTGFKEIRYDMKQKKVVYEPVTLDQEYRSFDFLSPWEGSDIVLPGDEKAKFFAKHNQKPKKTKSSEAKKNG
jgi:NADH-quinone oxidoreductase subunit C